MVQAQFTLARHLRLFRVHINAKRAAVELRSAHVDQLFKRWRQAAFFSAPRWRSSGC
ncbi:hypothetical protein BN126_2465 [Cronobacter sakazakii 680]|nr:hypothetical protein BN126_2465 [Cronobacter sakazakii 680]